MAERKTVVITGANAGIGLATAQLLAAKGYNIVAICRDKSKGEFTVRELVKANPGMHAENFTADLSDLGAVQKVANAITSKYQMIDRLINNAGYYPSAIHYVGDIEKTLLTSHLGHMLLTQLLIPSLQRSPEARVINVSSGIHTLGSIDRFFKRTVDHTFSNAYADAKLANTLFTLGLSKNLPQNVVTYSLHPGVVQTNFAKDSSGLFTVLFNMFRPFFISPERGAATSVYLADAEIQQVKSFTGQYFVRKKQTQVRHKDVTNENAAWLWKKSMEILNPYLSR
jgi:retinol dehydrogenase 12